MSVLDSPLPAATRGDPRPAAGPRGEAQLPVVVLAGHPPETEAALRDSLAGAVSLRSTPEVAAAFAPGEPGDVSLLCLGEHAPAAAVLLMDRSPRDLPRLVLSGFDPHSPAVEPLVRRGVVAYATPEPLPPELLAPLLRALATQMEPEPAPSARWLRALELARRLAGERDLLQLAGTLEAELRELLGVDRVHLWMLEPESGELRRVGVHAPEEEWHHAAVGAAGFAVRTGSTVAMEPGTRDPRWLPALDDPQGRDDAPAALVVPVSRGERTCGALAVFRSPPAAAFTAEEAAIVELAAAQAGLAAELFAVRAARRRAGPAQPAVNPGIFRAEALEHHVAGNGHGEVLRLSTAWAGWAFWLLVALFVAALAGAAALGWRLEPASRPPPAHSSTGSVP
ncbi:MAG TPA: GAF domain-containing protein [Longimicrobiaceae bacterium]|nr:GAF domain-containing protein [Longimicrobiaceae bacterium]